MGDRPSNLVQQRPMRGLVVRALLAVVTVASVLLVVPQSADAARPGGGPDTDAVAVVVDETSDGSGITVDGSLVEVDNRFLRRVSSWHLLVQAWSPDGATTVFDGEVDGPDFGVRYEHDSDVDGRYTATVEGRTRSGTVLFQSEGEWCCETAPDPVEPGSAVVPAPTFVYSDGLATVVSASGSVGEADGSAVYEVGVGFILCTRYVFPDSAACGENGISPLVSFTNEQVLAGEGFYDISIGETEAWILVTKRDADGNVLSRTEHRTPCDEYPYNYTCDTNITEPSVSEWVVVDGLITAVRGTTGGPDDADRIWGVALSSGDASDFVGNVDAGEFLIEFANPIPLGDINEIRLQKYSNGDVELGSWTFYAPEPPPVVVDPIVDPDIVGTYEDPDSDMAFDYLIKVNDDGTMLTRVIVNSHNGNWFTIGYTPEVEVGLNTRLVGTLSVPSTVRVGEPDTFDELPIVHDWVHDFNNPYEFEGFIDYVEGGRGLWQIGISEWVGRETVKHVAEFEIWCDQFPTIGCDTPVLDWDVQVDLDAQVGTYNFERIDGDLPEHDRVELDWAGGGGGIVDDAPGWHTLLTRLDATFPSTHVETPNMFNCICEGRVVLSIAKLTFYSGDVVVAETEWTQRKVELT